MLLYDTNKIPLGLAQIPKSIDHRKDEWWTVEAEFCSYCMIGRLFGFVANLVLILVLREAGALTSLYHRKKNGSHSPGSDVSALRPIYHI